MIRCFTLWLLLTCAVSLTAAPADDRAERENTGFDQAYGVIVQRNVFLRNRRPPQTPRPQDAQDATPPPPPIQAQYVLVGVVFEDDAARGYFEHAGTDTIVKVAPGDEIADGRIIDIRIDAVLYADESGQTRVEIGHDLTGRPATASAQAAPPTPASPAATARPKDAPTAEDGHEPSVEERLRRRRQQELTQ